MHRLARRERPPHHPDRPRPAGSAPTATFPRARSPPIENHASRPEVRVALDAAPPGVATRRSETVRPAADVRGGAGRARRGPGRGGSDAGGRDRPPGAARGGRRGAARPARRDRARARRRRARSPGRSPRSRAAARAIAAGDAAPLPALRHPRHRRAGAVAPRRCTASSATASTSSGASRPNRRRWSSRWSKASIAADARGRIVTANPAARRLLGLRRRPSRCPTCRSCSGSRPRARWWTSVLQGRPVQDRQLEMDGRVFLVNARPLPDRRRRARAARPHRGPPARGGPPRLRRQRVARAQDAADLDLRLRRDPAGRQRRCRDDAAVPRAPS